MNAIILTPESRQDQGLHQDRWKAGQIVEMHVALADYGLEAGPTQFCPCTHACPDGEDSPKPATHQKRAPLDAGESMWKAAAGSK